MTKWLLLVIGISLTIAVLFVTSVAWDMQQREQARRDAHWSEVNRRAAQSVPPILPGQAKPEPARLPLAALRTGLILSAVACFAGSVTTYLRRAPAH